MESILVEQLSTLAHPQRLAVFRLLVRRCPDALPAGEIAKVLNLKPSTSSVYLSALTRAGLITQTRAGRSLRYALANGAVQGLISDLLMGCCRGRPDLCPPELVTPQPSVTRKQKVLFICSGNSGRSILAEALLRHMASDRFDSYSAGVAPRAEVNAFAMALLQNNAIETRGLMPKSLQAVQNGMVPHFDFVFTVCDRAANQDDAEWAEYPIRAHWGVAEPGQDAEDAAHAMRRSFETLRHRIQRFADLPLDALDPISLQHAVDEIGRGKDIS